MDKETNDLYKELADNIDKLLDNYQAGKIDASAFHTVVSLELLKIKLMPYFDMLQNMDIKLFGHIGMILGSLSGKQIKEKEEQQTKEKLKQIEKIFNAIDSNKDEKDSDIAKIFDEMFKLLDDIFILISSDNN